MGEPNFSRLSFILVATFCLARAQDNLQCAGSIGNNDETEQSVTSQTESRFYVNSANPAPCSGNITSWRVCYYGPDNVEQNETNILYMSTYALYRKMGTGQGQPYEIVSDIFRAVLTTRNFSLNESDHTVVDGVIQEGGFNCFNDTINMPLPVLEGDLVGACIFDPDDGDDFTRQQLDIVSTITEDESLLEMVDSGCTLNQILSEFQTNKLTSVNNRRLHISANIELTTMSMTTSSATNSPTTAQGTTVQPVTQTDGISTNTLSAGAIAGLIIGILILLVLVVAIVLVILFLMKPKMTGGKYTKEKTERDFGITNMTYGNRQLLAAGPPTSELEASMYEVPVSTTQRKSTPHDNALSISTYAVPDLYEYATLGPNEEMDASSEHYYSPLDEATISYAKLLEKNKQEDIYGNVEGFLQPASEENEIYAQLKSCGIRNIPADLVKIEEHLGSGQFGSVEKGSWKNGAKSIPVALKLLKEGSSEIDKTKFLQEAAIMAQFRHPNVVNLFGVVSKSEPLMLVVELIQKGDLRKHLHTLRPDPGELPVISLPNLLLSFSQQVALGMHYLSSKGFVHRDLAARNILVSKDNICKIADFGMSRDLADETYYVSHGGMIPVKWTAPEAINFKKYSTTSDVWSYGCLLYEIWSLGYKPFEGVSNNKVIEMVDSGIRLSPPPGCPRIIYELMINCWNPTPVYRPSFREHLLTLLSSPEEVLAIPPEALGTHNLAGVLGSSLEAGEDMYKELQNRYIGNNDDYQEVD